MVVCILSNFLTNCSPDSTRPTSHYCILFCFRHYLLNSSALSYHFPTTLPSVSIKPQVLLNLTRATPLMKPLLSASNISKPNAVILYCAGITNLLDLSINPQIFPTFTCVSQYLLNY